MRKIFFTLFFMLLSFMLTVQAQKETFVRFGGVAGFNMSEWGGDDYKDLETTFKPGFHVGGIAEMMLTDHWSIQPELLFSYEGTNSDVLDKGISAMYIKFPILVFYNFYVGRGFLSPGIGGYCAAGIAGKIDGEQDLFESIGRFDWGVEARLAYELWNGIFASLGVSQGFTPTHSMGLKVSIGYKFPYSKWLHSTYYKKGGQEENNYNE